MNTEIQLKVGRSKQPNTLKFKHGWVGIDIEGKYDILLWVGITILRGVGHLKLFEQGQFFFFF